MNQKTSELHTMWHLKSRSLHLQVQSPGIPNAVSLEVDLGRWRAFQSHPCLSWYHLSGNDSFTQSVAFTIIGNFKNFKKLFSPTFIFIVTCAIFNKTIMFWHLLKEIQSFIIHGNFFQFLLKLAKEMSSSLFLFSFTIFVLQNLI